MAYPKLAHALQNLCANLELPEESFAALGSIVGTTLSGLIKDARTVALNSKRTAVSTSDVNTVLQMHGFEPVHGSHRFQNQNWLWVMGSSSVFLAQDKEYQTTKLDNIMLPTPPLDASVVAHWLAIDGVQPEIPENRAIMKKRRKGNTDDSLDSLDKQGGVKLALNGMIDGNVELNLPVMHVLSEEQQSCFTKIVKAVESAASDGEGTAGLTVLNGVSDDAALQPLVPYIVRYIACQVHCHMKDANILYKSLLLLGNLMKNPHLELERYGHQLLPCILSCLLVNNLGGPDPEDCWKLRNLAAVVIKLSVSVLGNALNDLHGRVTRQLCGCLENANHPLETQYGNAPSIAHVLRDTALRLEAMLKSQTPADDAYDKIIRCQTALGKVVQRSAPSSPNLAIREDAAGESMATEIGLQHIGA